MWVSLRWFGAATLGCATLLLAVESSALGQRPPTPPTPPAPSTPASAPAPQGAPNPNVYANPFATTGRFANTAVLGKALGNAAAPVGPAGSGYGSLLPGVGPDAGYGTLSASYANPALGYGSLNNANAGGGGYGQYGNMGYGMGFATQWMQNPYSGYLRGAASVTKANAEYYHTIQQAKLLRQEAIRSSIETRRAFLEEWEWEKAHMPDPEKIRQKWITKELERARFSPPATEILDARSLNALLRHLINQQVQGVKAEKSVPLSEDTLNNINLTVGDNTGNVGLLKDRGNLQWPQPLQSEVFKEPRETLNGLMKQAYKSAQAGNTPADNVLNDLQANYDQLRKALDANVQTLSFDEHLEANRYLRYVKNTITALKDPNVVNYFNGNWKANVKDVAQLVQFMREKGLWFASATPGTESAYRSLYYSLSALDAQMPRVASSTSGSSSD